MHEYIVYHNVLVYLMVAACKKHVTTKANTSGSAVGLSLVNPTRESLGITTVFCRPFNNPNLKLVQTVYTWSKMSVF